jgi:hypothetical protein
MIRIDLVKTELCAGETLTGHVTWDAAGGKQARSVTVVVRRVVSGKRQRREVELKRDVETDIASRPQISIPLHVEIPFGPLTYHGKLFSVVWEVFVQIDLPFAIDEKETVPFTVRPALWTEEQFRSFLSVDENAEDGVDDDGDLDDDDDDDDDESENDRGDKK